MSMHRCPPNHTSPNPSHHATSCETIKVCTCRRFWSLGQGSLYRPSSQDAVCYDIQPITPPDSPIPQLSYQIPHTTPVHSPPVTRWLPFKDLRGHIKNQSWNGDNGLAGWLGVSRVPSNTASISGLTPTEGVTYVVAHVLLCMARSFELQAPPVRIPTVGSACPRYRPVGQAAARLRVQWNAEFLPYYISQPCTQNSQYPRN